MLETIHVKLLVEEWSVVQALRQGLFIYIADLIPSRYGVLIEFDAPPARQPSDRETVFPLEHQSVPHARGLSFGYDLGDGIIGECMFT
jgi:allophanate hydrolase subunit 1